MKGRLQGERMGLLAEERHRYIVEALRSSGRIRVAQIASDLEVTEVTIRRDLAELEKKGLLKKSYGGAVMREPTDINFSVRYRQTKNLHAKQIIGKLASGLIEDGDIIFLEAGSTCYEVIPHLAGKRGLTVIVNSLYLMGRLHEVRQHKTILTGGEYRPDRMDMVGPTAEAAIAQLGGVQGIYGG
ncbi:MAG: DeoR/GlpR family DNA-binding transcription regulator [Planctomycetota bacterium]